MSESVMKTDDRDAVDRSLWGAITPGAPARPALEGDVKTDVAVVGGGILGLSLALHLAERGIGCVLVEARRVGFGASGRNTGFVVPSFVGGRGPQEISAHLGMEAGERLSRFVGSSGTVVFDLIRRLAIACDAEQTGWLQPAHTAEKLVALEERVRRWQAFGQPVRLLGAEETARRTGTTVYRGALLEPSGGQLNPLAYVRGLARAADLAGASLHENSPVMGFRTEEGRHRLDLARGRVLARSVVFTTNALVGSLVPEVRRALIPARPFQVATQPLDASVRARILPERNPLADLHNHTFAVRWSPDHRLVTGGLGFFTDRGAIERMARSFLARLHTYLPGLPILERGFAWQGVVATTPDFLPEIWSVGKGLYAPIGCNGRGIAVTTAMGLALATFLASGNPADLPVAVGPPRERTFHPLLALGPSFWLALNTFKDWRDDRRR